MAGGGHHEPPVFTHFLPGMVAGIVLGGVLGALFIAHLAAGSLQTFWEMSRSVSEPATVCTNLSGVHIASETLPNGSSYTSFTIGDGEETVFTIPGELLRTVQGTSPEAQYITAVENPSQVTAFPANSLYRINFCEKTITHVLGDNNEPVTVFGMSPSGVWALYGTSAGLLMMNTKEHRVIGLGEAAIPTSVMFSPFDDAVALLFADGSRSEWTRTADTNAFTREDAITTGELPAWTFQSPEEYFAEIN